MQVLANFSWALMIIVRVRTVYGLAEFVAHNLAPRAIRCSGRRACHAVALAKEGRLQNAVAVLANR